MMQKKCPQCKNLISITAPTCLFCGRPNKFVTNNCVKKKWNKEYKKDRFSNFNIRYTGCAALDLAYVAAGRFDGFFHNNINIWDVAAGSLMVQEAGGVVNDLNKFNNNAINIRASSDGINDKMLKELENF